MSDTQMNTHTHTQSPCLHRHHDTQPTNPRLHVRLSLPHLLNVHKMLLDLN